MSGPVLMHLTCINLYNPHNNSVKCVPSKSLFLDGKMKAQGVEITLLRVTQPTQITEPGLESMQTESRAVCTPTQQV